MTTATHPDDELGFDPDSPDVSDPQVDPPKPAKKPESEDAGEGNGGDDYPPYGTDQ